MLAVVMNFQNPTLTNPSCARGQGQYVRERLWEMDGGGEIWCTVNVMVRTPVDISTLSEEELDRLQIESDGRAFARHPGVERWWIGSIIVCTLILIIMGLQVMRRGAAEAQDEIDRHQDDATRITGESTVEGR